MARQSFMRIEGFRNFQSHLYLFLFSLESYTSFVVKEEHQIPSITQKPHSDPKLNGQRDI